MGHLARRETRQAAVPFLARVHIWHEWPADEAIAAGHPFAATELLPVLTDLARVCLDVTWPDVDQLLASRLAPAAKPALPRGRPTPWNDRAGKFHDGQPFKG